MRHGKNCWRVEEKISRVIQTITLKVIIVNYKKPAQLLLRMVIGRYILFIIIACTAITPSLAHSDGYNGNDHEQLSRNSFIVIAVASGFIVLCVTAAALKKKKSSTFKVSLYAAIVVITVATTAYLAVSTILLNVRSESGGPVHWHADFELWKCGERLDLQNPEGLSNRKGTSVFHEHNDQRIHVEGVVTEREDMNFENFFYVVDGELFDNGFKLPTNNGVVTVRNGDSCPPANGMVQAFLYRVTNPDPTKKMGFIYTQTKLDDVAHYIPAPYMLVPPGDCIIIEFDVEKEKTDKLCQSYQVARDNGYITEVNNGR